MDKATRINPSVLGYALPWAFSNWVGANYSGNPLNMNGVYYMTKFCEGGPKVTYNWKCDYIGIWNERDWSTDYVINLRNSLNNAGLNYTQIIVADDGDFNPAPVVLANATVAAAISILGVHYPGGSNSTVDAVETGKPLWASEDSSTYFDAAGGGCLARIINWNYIYGNMTALIVWNLISSYYDHLFWYGDSFMGAAYPHSGHYDITSPLWSAAHTTQFAFPGWHYLPISINMPNNYGGSGQLPGGGSYVTFVDTTGMSDEIRTKARQLYTACLESIAVNSNSGLSIDCPTVSEYIKQLQMDYFMSGIAFRTSSRNTNGPYDWSIILETQTTGHSQCIRSNPRQPWSVVEEQNITFTLSNDFIIPDTVVVWKSVFYTSTYEPNIIWFERQSDITVDKNTNSFTLYGIHPDSVYSLTSLDRGQSHGNPSPSPPNTPFPGTAPGVTTPLYTDDFQSYAVESMPNYFSDHCGSFAVMPRRDNDPSLAYEQVVVALPVAWGGDSLYPLTIIGDWNTTDQDVQVDTYIYSYSDIHPSQSPLVSVITCDSTDPGQVWYFNSSSSFALPNSLVDGQLNQCFDVFGCDPAPGTAIWMWPCVNQPQANCNSANQLWTFSSGKLISQMNTGYCVTIMPDNSVVMYSCGNTSLPSNSYQSFAYNPSTGLLQVLQNNQQPTGTCLCSRPPVPPNFNDDSTHIGIGLRLGGMVSTSSVAQAYASTWYNYGYWYSVRPDGSWTITRGTTPPSIDVSEIEKELRYKQRRQRPSRNTEMSNNLRTDNRIILANGTLPSGTMGLQQWHTLRFTVINTTLTAYFDNQTIGTVQDTVYPVGWSGLSSGWHISQFKEFSLGNGKNRN